MFRESLWLCLFKQASARVLAASNDHVMVSDHGTIPLKGFSEARVAVTNSMAYGTRRFNATFTRPLQLSLYWVESTQFLILIPDLLIHEKNSRLDQDSKPGVQPNPSNWYLFCYFKRQIFAWTRIRTRVFNIILRIDTYFVNLMDIFSLGPGFEPGSSTEDNPGFSWSKGPGSNFGLGENFYLKLTTRTCQIVIPKAKFSWYIFL